MIAKHDLVLELTLRLCLSLSLLSHCSFSFTHSLFHSLPLHLIFLTHQLCLPRSLSFIHCLSNCISITFILLVSSLPLCYTHLPALTSMHSLFLNLSPFHNLLFFSFLTSPSLSLSLLLLSSLLLFSIYLFLSPSTTCATEGNIASSGPY